MIHVLNRDEVIALILEIAGSRRAAVGWQTVADVDFTSYASVNLVTDGAHQLWPAMWQKFNSAGDASPLINTKGVGLTFKPTGGSTTQTFFPPDVPFNTPYLSFMGSSYPQLAAGAAFPPVNAFGIILDSGYSYSGTWSNRINHKYEGSNFKSSTNNLGLIIWCNNYDNTGTEQASIVQRFRCDIYV